MILEESRVMKDVHTNLPLLKKVIVKVSGVGGCRTERSRLTWSDC